MAIMPNQLPTTTTTPTIIGHAAVVSRLAAAVPAPHHAYLFTGPPHVGKRTLATAFAAALLCERPEPGLSACGRCAQCLLRLAGNHPDLLELPREGKLSIDQIRGLKRVLSLGRHSAEVRVGVIPEAERLAGPAQNALLKVLEEPPPQTVLLLSATTPEALLPTTVSRCQQVRLGIPAASELRQRLTDWQEGGAGQPSVASLESAISASAGRPGLAIRLLQDPERLAERHAWAEQLVELAAAPVTTRLSAAKQLADDPNLPEVLEWWLQLHREALVAEHASPAGDDAHGKGEQDQAAQGGASPPVVALARQYTVAQLTANMRALVAARRRLGYNPNVLLLVESTLLSLGET